MTARDREGTGISLQNYHSEVQMALLEPSSLKDQQNQIPDRTITFSQWTLTNYQSEDVEPIPNEIKNQKYSLLTFVPIVLYQQFQYFFNMFYLLTAISQFIPILKVGLLFSFVAPLVLVLLLTMLKEAYEDYQRYIKDKEINSAEYTVFLNKNQKLVKKSSELRVGDIVQISTGQSIPADCILLASSTEKSSLFIKTDQLDGETDWKLRKSIFDSHEKVEDCLIQFSNPKVNIYEFIGSIRIGENDKLGLSIENTLWRSVKIASGKGLLMVIYTGKQTKLSLNSKEAVCKFGKLDEELNYFSKLLFLLMVTLSLMLILLRGSYGELGQLFIIFFKYFLLLSSIIPISMRVNLDFAKLVYKLLIDHDKQMSNSLCRNSNIPEELGRIEYILSDKTGTLTQNDMIFKKLYISEEIKYEADESHIIGSYLSQGVRPCEDIQATNIFKKRQQVNKVVDVIAALMLCHNVTPVIEDDGHPALQGSSPDQLTLVKYGESLNYKLKERTQDLIELINPNGKTESYEVLDIFPFTSESKSMGIIVKSKQSKKIVFYLKGADVVIQPKIPVLDANFMAEACLDLAREGLRTLVITEKLLSEEYYDKWKKDYSAASASLKSREEKILECRKRLEANMMFLGVTGVEDKLQEGVVETVGSARSIGIKVWMLTGDKVETAICVGRAVKLIQSKDEDLFIIQGIKNKETFLEKLTQFYKFVKTSKQEFLAVELVKCVLVIDGASLKFALSEIEEEFFNIAIRLPAIICSRVSPTQKAEIASLVIKYNKSNGRVLGIGDGGNDVALIQSAHVGIGIYGKEGIQAALASDFSIEKFSDLNHLLYWHGRLAYKRSSHMAQFIIHRGVIITIMQTIFIIQFYFVPLPIYNGFLLLGYSTIFTMLPVFSLILDEDISRKLALDYPILYKSTQEGNEVSYETFTYWMLISFYQGSIIMILISVILVEQSFYMVTTVSFTCLIFIQFLNVFTDLHKIHIAQIISTLLSVVIYAASLIFMKKSLNGGELFTSYCLMVTILIVAVAWLPPFIFEKIKRYLKPSEEEKMMSQTQSSIFSPVLN